MTRMTRVLACVAGLVLAGGGVGMIAGPEPQRGGRREPEGTAVLSGRAVAVGTGAPIRDAEVSLDAADRRVRRRTLTDADGQYAFERLPVGEYTIRIEKPGYLRLAYGQRDAFGRGTPVVLAAGERLDRVNFAVPRGSVITVRVIDSGGEPVAAAAVRVQQFQYRTDGQRQLTSASPGSQFGTTDDRGEFRAYGLMPGEYVIGATPGTDEAARANGIVLTEDGSEPASSRVAPTYYAGTIDLDRATPISIGVAEETVVSLAMVAARLGRIAGTVVDSRGRPAAGAQIQLSTRQAATVLPSRNVGRVANDGTFSIGGLPPGEHLLTVSTANGRAAGNDDREREFASVPVVVSGDDVTGLYLVARPGIDVSGRVVIPEGASLPPRVRVRAEALGEVGNSATSRPLEGAAFELSGVAGRVLVDALLPSGWAVASVTLDGRDITNEPLELAGRASLSGIVIALTNAPTRVAGRVTDGAGRPLRDYVVVMQPAELLGSPEATNRLVRAVRPDVQGRFEVSGLRPGRYLATAIPALQEGREYSPEFRERLRPAARELTLGAGAELVLDLPITRGL